VSVDTQAPTANGACHLASDETGRSGVALRGPADDQTPRSAVTNVRAIREGDQVTMDWITPDADDLAGVIIRSYPGMTPLLYRRSAMPCTSATMTRPA
jgi:hypothetical protein